MSQPRFNTLAEAVKEILGGGGGGVTKWGGGPGVKTQQHFSFGFGLSPVTYFDL